jgi:predicted glycosyltransferase
MNHRIKILAEQAGINQDQDEDGTRFLSMLESSWVKFAQSIVEECIECTKEWREDRIANSARDYSRGYVHGCDEAIAEMKKRFGVEEQTVSQKMTAAGYTRRPRGWTKEGTE